MLGERLQAGILLHTLPGPLVLRRKPACSDGCSPRRGGRPTSDVLSRRDEERASAVRRGGVMDGCEARRDAGALRWLNGCSVDCGCGNYSDYMSRRSALRAVAAASRRLEK